MDFTMPALITVKKKTPEEKKLERISNKAKRLYFELETDHGLTVDDQVEAIMLFVNTFIDNNKAAIVDLEKESSDISNALKKLDKL